MVKGKEIKKILIYSFLLIITALIYLFFGNFWEFMSKISFLNEIIVVPVTKFLNTWNLVIAGLNLSGKEIIIATLLSIGVIITAILLCLIGHQILKIIKIKNENSY